MIKWFAVVWLLRLATETWGQATVHFGNTPTTLITTNDLQGNVGNIAGAGNYEFGLYVSPFVGGPLTMVAVAANGLLAGRFDGGMLAPTAPPGTQLSFQVRGWSDFAGNSFEEAYNIGLLNNVPTAHVGESTVGFFTVPASGTIELFGTGPGQVGGFVLAPVVPEPSTWALAILGLAARSRSDGFGDAGIVAMENTSGQG